MRRKSAVTLLLIVFAANRTYALSEMPENEYNKVKPGIDPLVHQNSVAQGKEQYLVIVQNSKMPRFGTCWTSALKKLEEGCQHLTDETQGRLALNFANCFLMKAGLKPYPCDGDTPLEECLRDVDSNGFTAYSQFFTHSQSMCHFLQSQIWHEETENTISRLADNSHKVSQKLEDASHLQDEMIRTQKLSLNYQEELLASSTHLGKTLESSKDHVRLMLDEFRSSTDEQRNLIFEVFNRVSKLQNLVLGEVSGFYSLLFYPFAFCAAYLMTSAKRTAEARFWLLLLLILSLGVERLVCAWSIKDDNSVSDAQELSEILLSRTWRVRYLALFAGFGLIGIVAYNFKDYNVVNHTLLLEIQRQNLELGSFLQRYGFKESFTIADQVDYSKLAPNLDSQKLALLAEMSDADESVSSYDTDASDMTFMCLEDSDRESFYTASTLVTPAPSADGESRSAASTPQLQLSVSRYNLRSRSRQSNKSWASDAVENESPSTFYHLVKKTEQLSQKNSRKILQALKERPVYYSSDEEL